MTHPGRLGLTTVRSRAVPRLAAASALAIVYTIAMAHGVADDFVIVDLKGDGSGIRIRGEVTDYVGGHLEIRPSGSGIVKRYHADQIVEISISQSSSHEAGDKALSEERWEAAEQHFREALAAEDRLWVRRELLAVLVHTDLRRGDYETAVRDFIAITESDPQTHHAKFAPLVWDPLTVGSLPVGEFRGWLDSPSPAARLVAASYLVDHDGEGDRAEATLRELAAAADPTIQDLAQAQKWRLRLKTNSVTPNEIRRWERTTERMPEETRGGPYFLIGRAHLQHLDHDHAAMAFLWLPLVYTTDYQLAAVACYEAAEALRAIGHIREAVALYGEIEARFPGTIVSEDASHKLAELMSEPPSSD